MIGFVCVWTAARTAQDNRGQDRTQQPTGKDWRDWMTNEKKQKEKAAATRRAGDGAFVPGAHRGGADWLGYLFSLIRVLPLHYCLYSWYGMVFITNWYLSLRV